MSGCWILPLAPLLVIPAGAQTPPSPASVTSAAFLLPHAAAAGPGIDRNGTLKITLNLLLNGMISNGTPVTANAIAGTNDPSFQSGSNRSASANAEAGAVSIVLEIPYDWQVSSTTDKVMISIGVSAYAKGNIGEYAFTESFTTTVALPASGAVTPVMIQGTL
ncbi:MAG: hypothetical protein ACLPSF_13270 [Methylocella sp.]